MNFKFFIKVLFGSLGTGKCCKMRCSPPCHQHQQNQNGVQHKVHHHHNQSNNKIIFILVTLFWGILTSQDTVLCVKQHCWIHTRMCIVVLMQTKEGICIILPQGMQPDVLVLAFCVYDIGSSGEIYVEVSSVRGCTVGLPFMRLIWRAAGLGSGSWISSITENLEVQHWYLAIS